MGAQADLLLLDTQRIHMSPFLFDGAAPAASSADADSSSSSPASASPSSSSSASSASPSSSSPSSSFSSSFPYRFDEVLFNVHHLLVNAVESSSIETVIADGTVVVRAGRWALPLNLTARGKRTRGERRRRNQKRTSVATAKSDASASVSAGTPSSVAAATKRSTLRPSTTTGDAVNSNADFGIDVDVEASIEPSAGWETKISDAAEVGDDIDEIDEIDEADPDAWADDAVPTEAQMAAYVTALRYRVYERVVNGASECRVGERVSVCLSVF